MTISCAYVVLCVCVYDLLQTARIPRMLGKALTPVRERLNRLLSKLTQPKSTFREDAAQRQRGDRLYNTILLVMIGCLVAWVLHFIMTTVGMGEVFKTSGLGLLTLLRVTVLLLFATVIWTPIGVAIGFNPTLVMFGFAEVSQGNVRLTEIGQDFATTTILRSKDLFRQQALTHVPVLTSIVQTLREKRSGSMRADFFLDLSDEHFPHEEAERQFATAVDWGRYAELFEYDASEDRLYLPEVSSDLETAVPPRQP